MKLGIVMDPAPAINAAKDSSVAMLLEAQSRGWALYYMELQDLFLADQQAAARMRAITVYPDTGDWYHFDDVFECALSELDVILMRKDPPVDMPYIYATYLLELAERHGTLVVNSPAALRNANEKLFISQFPQCTTATLVSSNTTHILTFLKRHHDVILKPLNGMGGQSIFRVQYGDLNTNVIVETLLGDGRQPIMAQRFIPAIKDGDKRILVIDGEPLPYALARIPKDGEVRGNLARGGTARGVEFGQRDRWVCEQLASTLKAQGLLFVGLDVIGDYLTEINVTSPTCIREMDALFGINIARVLMDAIERQLDKTH